MVSSSERDETANTQTKTSKEAKREKTYSKKKRSGRRPRESGSKRG